MPTLDRLTADIRACRLCVDSPKGRELPHEPRPVFRVSPTARICIAGQAPGTRVHASGTPFTDPSGDRLRDWMGVTPEEFYDVSRIAIVPMGFCYPGRGRGGDLPPRPECAATWHPRLLPLLTDVELVLAIGHYAQAHHLGPRRGRSLTDTVRAWREHAPRVIPLPHPSPRNTLWLRRNPWFEDEVLPMLRRRVAELLAQR